jgi:hypothetical protein
LAPDDIEVLPDNPLGPDTESDADATPEASTIDTVPEISTVDEQKPRTDGLRSTGGFSGPVAERFTLKVEPAPKTCTLAVGFDPSDSRERSTEALTLVEAPPASVPEVGDTLNGAGLPVTLKSSGRSPVFVSVIDPEAALDPRSIDPPLTVN